MLKVTTFKPFRRVILVRFSLSVYILCFLLIILLGSIVWIKSSCESNCALNRIVSQNQANHIVFEKEQISKKFFSIEEIWKIEEAKRCFLPPNINIYDGIELLEDILSSEKRPMPGNSIFFHETSCTTDGKVVLNAR